MRDSSRYLLVGREGADRPEPSQAAWLYSQMVRWGQTAISRDALATAMAVFRPDMYDAALGKAAPAAPPAPFTAFAGPSFDAGNIEGYLAALAAPRRTP